MAAYYEAFNAKLEAFLQEKNRITEVLEKLEKASGVKRIYIAQGSCPIVDLDHGLLLGDHG